MKGWLVTLAALAISVDARAQDEVQPPPPPPPEAKPQPKVLGTSGESCRTSDDCEPELGCIAGACGSRKQDEPKKEMSPVEHYRMLSVSLLSDAGTTFTFESDTSLAALNLGASVRLVLQGFVMGAQLSILYEKSSSLGSSFELGVMEPGITLGYAFAAGDRVAITPSAHALFLLPFTNGAGSASAGEFTGELAVTCFVGMNGFIEPYVTAGDFQLFQGSAAFLLGVGYRLGVTF